MVLIIWVVVALLSLVILVRGISRMRTFENTSDPLRAPNRTRANTGAASSTLEEYGKELLSEELVKLRSQQSSYDIFFDWLSQRFTFWQSRMLVSDWRRFFTDVNEAVDDQNEFIRRTSSRSNIPLETEKTARSLRADIAEEKLRGARANHDKKNLGKKSEIPKPESERPLGERAAEALQWRKEEEARLEKAGFKPGDREWELLLNEYDRRINRIFGAE
jgi:hypothetical protein